MTPWDELPRLRHQMTRALSHHYRVLYISLPTDWRRKRAAAWSDPEPNIMVWSPSNWFTLPGRITAMSPLARICEIRYLRRSLERWLSARSIKPVALVTFDYRHSWLLDHPVFPRTVYVCNDDFSVFAPTPRLAKLVLAQMQHAAERADECLATAAPLAQTLGIGARARVFLPPHDIPVADPYPVAPYQSGQRIRVGFMGYLDRRLDMHIIDRVAAEPDLEWHMVGPVAPKSRTDCRPYRASACTVP